MTSWHTVNDLYVVCNKKIANIPKKKAIIDWVGIDCVYKRRSEKTRKALVQLMGWETKNPGITTTKLWESIKKTYKPNIGDIKIGIIATNDIEKVYNKETI